MTIEEIRKNALIPCMLNLSNIVFYKIFNMLGLSMDFNENYITYELHDLVFYKGRKHNILSISKSSRDKYQKLFIQDKYGNQNYVRSTHVKPVMKCNQSP